MILFAQENNGMAKRGTVRKGHGEGAFHRKEERLN